MFRCAMPIIRFLFVLSSHMLAFPRAAGMRNGGIRAVSTSGEAASRCSEEMTSHILQKTADSGKPSDYEGRS